MHKAFGGGGSAGPRLAASHDSHHTSTLATTSTLWQLWVCCHLPHAACPCCMSMWHVYVACTCAQVWHLNVALKSRILTRNCQEVKKEEGVGGAIHIPGWCTHMCVHLWAIILGQLFIKSNELQPCPFMDRKLVAIPIYGTYTHVVLPTGLSPYHTSPCYKHAGFSRALCTGVMWV